MPIIFKDEEQFIEDFHQRVENLLVGRTDRLELFQDLELELKQSRKMFLNKFGYPFGLSIYLDSISGALIHSCRVINENRKPKEDL